MYLGPEKDATFLLDIYVHGGLIFALPVGIISGMGLQYVLAPLLTGTVAGGRLHWARTAGVALGSVLTTGALYFSLSQPAISDFYWITRYNTPTGEAYSWNARTHASAPSAAMGVAAQKKREVRNAFHFLRHPLRYMFANRVEKENLVLGEPIKKPAQVLPDSLTSLAELDDFAATYQLIDNLLRLKHLQRLEEQTGLPQTDKKEHVREECRKKFGLDPEPLLEDLCSVVACAEALDNAKSQSETPDQQQIQWFEELRERASNHARLALNPPSRPLKLALGAERAHRLLEVLLANARLFDKEYFAKLGVRIPAQEYVRRVEVRRRKERTNKALWYVAGVSLGLAATGAAVAYSSSK